MSREETPTLELRNVYRSFKQGSQTLEVLRGINLNIEKGEIVALIGPSGSGKSTMLQIAGLLEKPTKGEIYLNGQKCSKLGDMMRTGLRRDYLGFVYQYHNLLADFDATENVMLPQLIAGVGMAEAKAKAEWLLKRLGLEKRFKHRPAEMSGGEQQRVAIARALINNPAILLADEPTGNLDPQMAWEIMMLLQEINKMGTTVVVVTHNNDVVDIMKKRVVTLDNGSIVSDEQEGGYQYERD